MDPSDFYISYHIVQMQDHPPSEDLSNFTVHQPVWPSTQNTVYDIPTTTPDVYPMSVSATDIINTTTCRSDPAQVYSGIEPLTSLQKPALLKHFQDTSLPETAALLGKRKHVGFIPPSNHIEEQKALLRQMEASMGTNQNY